MLKAIIFDFGHTIMDELKDRGVSLRTCPIHLMPGVLETLPRLQIKLGIWANTRKTRAPGVRHWLKRAGIDNYFSWVVTSVDAGARKPDPRFFAYALEACGLGRDDLLFVGNQLNTDIQGAIDYGIPNVWLSGAEYHSPDDNYAPGQVEPTYQIKTLIELPMLMEKIGSNR